MPNVSNIDVIASVTCIKSYGARAAQIIGVLLFLSTKRNLGKSWEGFTVCLKQF